MKLDVTSVDYETYMATKHYEAIYYDSLSDYLDATLITGNDTLRVRSDFPGHFEFGEVKPGKAELIIEKIPSRPIKFMPYSEQLTILPGDNVAFVELKLEGEDTNPMLPLLYVTPEDMKNHPMPVHLEEDGLHYAIWTDPLKIMDNETFNRLNSFPGLTIKDRERVLSGDETKYVRVHDTLVFTYQNTASMP